MYQIRVNVLLETPRSFGLGSMECQLEKIPLVLMGVFGLREGLLEVLVGVVAGVGDVPLEVEVGRLLRPVSSSGTDR